MTSTARARSRTKNKNKPKKAVVDSATISLEQGQQFIADLERHAPWQAWAEKLASRKKPATLRKLMRQSRNPLEWSVDVQCDASTREVLKLLDSVKRQWRDGEPADWAVVVGDWLSNAEARQASVPFALECLAWANTLARLAVRLPAKNWWDLFAFLLNTALDAQAAAEREVNHPVASQLFSAELPLTLAYWFPRVELCSALATPARKAISEAMIELLDGEGMPQARYVCHWRGLLASWTRCVQMDAEIDGGQIDKQAKMHFEWLVRQTIRWRRSNGSFVFEENSKPPCGDELIEAAIRCGGDQLDQDCFQCSMGKLEPRQSSFDLPSPGEHSEWAEAAILRSHWAAKSSYLATTFDSSRLLTELGARGSVIWSGDDVPEIRIENEPLEITSDWEELCWSSDDDMDYLELEVRLNNSWRLQRQMLLARRDRFLFSADVLIGGTKPSKIHYCRPIPFTDQVELIYDDQTCEIGMKAKRNLGCLIPLALNEWKSDTHLGEFDGQALRQRSVGVGLYAPLFVDLDPKRQRKSRTWRQLTVAEQLRLVDPSEAVAYRVQIGQQNWVFYRSLSGAKNRTFLGQNVINEFLVARFLPDGEIETLIEIE